MVDIGILWAYKRVTKSQVFGLFIVLPVAYWQHDSYIYMWISATSTC